MTTLNISLPDAMRAFIDEEIARGEYSTASEYIRRLIRDDQKRVAEDRLERLLQEGLESGEPVEISDESWQRKKAILSRRLNENSAR
jgi:antitoxin ParD1/3/4